MNYMYVTNKENCVILFLLNTNNILGGKQHEK